jgi:hypothetical protein
MTHPLDVLFERATALSGRVGEGRLMFLDAVDLAYDAAVASGLVEKYGDDVCQLVLADAFRETAA